MTEKKVVTPERLYHPILKSLIPECLYQESKLFKDKKHGFPPPRHPGNLQAVFSLPLNASIRGP